MAPANQETHSSPKKQTPSPLGSGFGACPGLGFGATWFGVWGWLWGFWSIGAVQRGWLVGAGFQGWLNGAGGLGLGLKGATGKMGFQAFGV